MTKLKNAAVLTAGAAALAGLAGFMGAGTAAADTASCSDTLPAHTTGNPPNDMTQQFNKGAGQMADLFACTVKSFNQGMNGADDTTG
ncbi:hypothetical protein CTZ27_12160 [Streptomyces griseocarneus]|nr:hypothetical protein CTZ27_12160 [Streptomyces griseocarneus]